MTNSSHHHVDPVVTPDDGRPAVKTLGTKRYSREVTRNHRLPHKGTRGRIAHRLYTELLWRALPDRAATLGYYTVATAIPTLMAFYAIVMLLLDQNRADVLAITDGFISNNVPEDFSGQARGIIKSILGTTQRSLVTLLIAVLFALFSSSAYVRAFSRSANALYGRKEGRGIVRTWLVMWGLTIALVFGLVLVAVGFFLREDLLEPLLSHVAKPLGLVGLAEFLLDRLLPVWAWLRWPVIFLLSQMLIALLYHIAPNVKKSRFQLLTLGSVSALVLLTLIGWGFRIYINNFLHLGMYGALGGIIGGMLCVLLGNTALLLGLVLDAELARARELSAGLDSEELILAPPRASGADAGGPPSWRATPS